MHGKYRDKQLIALISEDNSEAFKQLFDRYWEPLFAAAVHRLQSDELAKDVLQELFIGLWEKRGSLTIQSNVAGYLFTALKHRIINKIKAENTREKYEKMTIQFYETNNLATEHQFFKKHLQEEMEKKAGELPDRCREVFELSRMEQLSHKEIGKKLNISPKTVENHIGRALKVLRPHLKKVVGFLLALPWL